MGRGECRIHFDILAKVQLGQLGVSDFAAVVSFVEKTRQLPSHRSLWAVFYQPSSPRLIIDLNISSPNPNPKIHRSQHDLAPLTSSPSFFFSPIIDPNILRSTFLCSQTFDHFLGHSSAAMSISANMRLWVSLVVVQRKSSFDLSQLLFFPF